MSTPPAVSGAAALLRDRGDAYDRWAPRLLHEPLLAGMVAVPEAGLRNPDGATRRIVAAYLQGVDAAALAAHVTERVDRAMLGGFNEERLKVILNVALQLITPDTVNR